MRHQRPLGSVFCALACLIAGPVAVAPAVAQERNMIDPSKTPKWESLPDWNGMWERDGHILWDPRIPIGTPQVPPPFNAEYAKKFQEAQAAQRQGKPIQGTGECVPAGMPTMMTMVFPMEIRINPTQVTIIAEQHSQVRRIHTDGRGHPKEPFPSTVGHSIGEWKNGELFIDTCCIKERWDRSDSMTVKERLWAPDPNTLKLEMTVEDPKAYTKPRTTEKTYRRRPDWEAVEYICQENNRNPVGADGTVGVILPGEPGSGSE